MFCVKCGKDDRNTIRGMCIPCFLDGRQIVLLAERVDLERCTNCEEFFLQGKWQSMTTEEAVERAAEETLKHISEAKVRDVALGSSELDPRNFSVFGEIIADIDDVSTRTECSSVVRIKNTVCKRCSRQLGNYYESTLQIRSSTKDLEDSTRDEILRRIVNTVETMSKSNRHVFITKVEEVSGGVDLLLSSISLGKSLARDIEDTYGGEFKESSKLVGKTSDGEDMYRLTYLVRLPEYGVGDAVSFNSRIYKLTWLGKNGGKLLDLENFRETTIRKNDLKSMRVAAKPKDLREATVVNATAGEIQILDPRNYSTVDLRIPEDFEAGETVTVAVIDDLIYLMP
jgi:NMD protein affecting ribosome stability and mRNA decay